MGDTHMSTLETAPAGPSAEGSVGRESVGATLTLSAEHLRGQHVAAHRHCWRCERAVRAARLSTVDDRDDQGDVR
jgi:hypothetical protein